MTASINLSKIDKTKIIDGKNGKYIDLVIWFNEQPDQYGNILSFQLNSKKDAQDEKVYFGSAKLPADKAPSQTPDPTPTSDEPLPF
jgi:hypothetical protein